MRRALLVAGVAIPLVVLAAISASDGQLLETTNFSAKTQASYVNLAQCQGSATSNPLNIEFRISAATGGTYNLFASSAAPATVSGGSVLLCADQSSPSATPPIYAGSVSSGITADSQVKDVAVSGSLVVQRITPPGNPTCDASQENQQIFICAHWTDSNSQKNLASATGKFILQFAKPDAPTAVSAGPGSDKLYVSWTASSTSGPTLADHYVAAATPTAGGSTIFSQSVTGTSVTIGGLTNGTEYSVVVYAYSIGGNQSDASPSATGTPVPGADFWDVYKDRGGQEQGGCATGGAGALGLLGAAAVLVLRRRKR